MKVVRIFFLFAFILLLNVSAEETITDSNSAKARLKEVSDWAKKTANGLEIRNVETDVRFELRKESLLRWSNPIVGEVYGDSYVWTDDKRPVAFLSFYAHYDQPAGERRLTLQSLSEDKIYATYEDTVVWRPKMGGIKYVNFSAKQTKGIGAPKKSAALRRIQLRRLAERFSGRVKEKNSDRMRELRLLTTALYQYQSKTHNVADGAIFALADTTDPELLVIIEARENQDKFDWVYAPVRQNHRRLQLSYDNVMVWDEPNPRTTLG